jgi:hypothetical protein
MKHLASFDELVLETLREPGGVEAHLAAAVANYRDDRDGDMLCFAVEETVRLLREAKK